MPYYPVTVRAQALTLLAIGWSIPQVQQYLDMPKSTVESIKRRARQRGYDSQANNRIELQFVEDAPRSSRPKEITKEKEQEVLDIVQKDRNGREKSAEVIAYESKLSMSSVKRILKDNKFSSVKPTWKPGLSEKAKADRVAFAKIYEHWTLEQWKDVVWSDETSVILGHRRGGLRVWRTVPEKHEPSCIRRRWKGFNEFMFWGCFTYDKKGPCYIWKKETAAEKELARINREEEPRLRREWELNTHMARLKLRRKMSGRKPIWSFTAKTGKLVRKCKAGGIDWYRYQKVRELPILVKQLANQGYTHKQLILKPKLIPFALLCKRTRPNTIIQEDNAPAHAHAVNQQVFKLSHIKKMLWPANSPDLNMIEPAWNYMKRRTTSRGAPTTRKEMEAAWIHAWKTLPQERIQSWIERIPYHIKKIIELDGGNEYCEGRPKEERRKRGQRKGELSELTYLGKEDDEGAEYEDDLEPVDIQIRASNLQALDSADEVDEVDKVDELSEDESDDDSD